MFSHSPKICREIGNKENYLFVFQTKNLEVIQNRKRLTDLENECMVVGRGWEKDEGKG